VSTVVIVGPTASGKSAVALEIARRVGGEILTVDSMQVYRGMDVGTAKPTEVEQAEVAHHLIDLVEPEAEYTLVDYQRAFDQVAANLGERGWFPSSLEGPGCISAPRSTG